MKDANCPYCAGGKADSLGRRVWALNVSTVYLFPEQSHRGRVVVVSRSHAAELIDLPLRERQAFMEDVATVARALRQALDPQRINYGAFGDTCGHLHFHLVPMYADDAFEWGEAFALNPQRKFLSDGEAADLSAKIAAELVSGGVDLRRSLEEMRREIMADGRIDFGETSFLLKVLSPLEDTGATIGAFVKALREVRADRVITQAESDRIMGLLDDLLA